MKNSILWGNTSAGEGPEYGGYDGYLGGYEVSYSNVRGGYGGVGNIDSDPMFLSADDYHISLESPCVNAGNPNYVGGANEVDIDGEPRVINGRVDMGADELDWEGPVLGASAWNLDFYYYGGAVHPESRTLAIENRGPGAFAWEIAEDCPWLKVDGTGGVCGQEPNYVGASVAASELPQGVQMCEAAISADGAACSPRLLRVNLYESGPVIEVSPAEFSLLGLVNWKPQGQAYLYIRNSGQGILNWELSCDCNWLTVSSARGSLSEGRTEYTWISITGLGVGVHKCDLVICDPVAENSPQVVPVELSILEHCFCTTPEYAEQLAEFLKMGAPECWCAPPWAEPFNTGHQCDGDAAGRGAGPLKYVVYLDDLNVLIWNWKTTIDSIIGPCADIDHKAQGPQRYRVFTNDLAILVKNWKKGLDELPGDCPRPDGQ